LGCDEDIIGTQSDDGHGQVYGSIHGIVTDYNSDDLLQGILVNWVSNGVADTTFTDENGYYSITDLIPGDYNLIFSGEDTTLAVQYAVIEEEKIVINKLKDLVAPGDYDNHPIGNYYIEVVKDVQMYSMNSSATGYVYLEVDAEETIVGNSVTVIAEYDETLNIKPSQYTATTDALGNYTFSNIPAADGVTFKPVQFTDDDYTFEAEVLPTKDLVPGVEVMVDHITMDQKIASEAVLLSNNFENNDFQIGADPTGTFNEAIDWEDYNFVMNFISTSEDYEISWTNGSKTFTIYPDEDLTLEKDYMINISGSTVAGEEINESYTFKTQNKIKEISSSLETYDDSGPLIGKTDAISWIFSESLATTKFTFNVHEQGCNDADYSNQNTCLCGDSSDNGGVNGQWNGTNEECYNGAFTGHQWRWSLKDGNNVDNEEDCNITVTQWNDDAEQNLTLCFAATVNSTTNTVTLPAPTISDNYWGRKLVDNGNGTTITYEDITVHYKYVSTLATYDEAEATVTICIEECDE